MPKEPLKIDNFEIHKDRNMIVVLINPRIYSLDVIISAGYILMDKAYVIIDGNPNDKIFVQLRPKKEGTNLEDLGRMFNEELINYSIYAVQTAVNQQIRTAIIQRAFLTHSEAEELKKRLKDKNAK
jgi:His-Xaa-Ser system protein HxsD